MNGDGRDDELQAEGDSSDERRRLWGGLGQLVTFATTPGEALRRRVIHAGAWNFSLRMTQRLLMFARTVVLARILAPSDFGLWGIAVLAMSLVDSLTQTGFRKALIQREGDIAGHLNTTWTVEIIRNTVIAIFLIALAPLADLIFDTEGATALVIIVGVAAWINGFVNIGVVYFERDLEFHRRFVLELAPTIADVVVGIAAAIATRSALAFALGMLAASLTRVTVSYVMVNYRPRLRFDKAKAKELLGFGKWIFAYGVIIYLVSNLDYMVVGIVLGVAALGLYTMAYNLSHLVSTELTRVSSQVAFPAYSKIQSDAARLSRAYLKALSAIAFAAFPITVGTAVLAEDITLVLLGDQWAPMVTALQILAFAGLSRALAGTSNPLFEALGRPDVLVKVSFVRLVLLGVIIYPLTIRLGIDGAALAVLLSSLAVHGVQLYLASRFSESPIRSMMGAVAYPAAHAAVMAVVLLGVRALLPDDTGLLALILLFGMGVVTYVGATLFSHTILGYDAQGIVPMIRRARRSDPTSTDSP